MEDLRSCCWRPTQPATAAVARRAGSAATKDGAGIVSDLERPAATEAEDDNAAAGAEPSSKEVEALFTSRAWNLSISPAKNIGPSLFMIYMMGGGIFGLMFLGFSLLNAVKSLLAVNKVFDDFERAAKVKGSTYLQRAAYSAICIGFIAYFVHRAVSTGILPIGPGGESVIHPRNGGLAAEPIPLVL